MKNLTGKNLEDLYNELYAKNLKYSEKSIIYIEEIKLIIDYLKPKSILDYGCGKAVLSNKIAELYPNIDVYQYDPSIKGLETIPVDKVDLVINTNIIEYLPEAIIINIFEKISSLTNNIFFILSHNESLSLLSSNENPNITIRDRKWYDNLIQRYFGFCNMYDTKYSNDTIALTFYIPNKLEEKHCNTIEVGILEKKINNIFNILEVK